VTPRSSATAAAAGGANILADAGWWMHSWAGHDCASHRPRRFLGAGPSVGFIPRRGWEFSSREKELEARNTLEKDGNPPRRRIGARNRRRKAGKVVWEVRELRQAPSRNGVPKRSGPGGPWRTAGRGLAGALRAVAGVTHPPQPSAAMRGLPLILRAFLADDESTPNEHRRG
jgi:hypothetical protein